jgi:hypothetical protein
MRAQCVFTHRISSAIGLLLDSFSVRAGNRLAANTATIHHLATACKTLFGADPAGFEAATGESSERLVPLFIYPQKPHSLLEKKLDLLPCLSPHAVLLFFPVT